MLIASSDAAPSYLSFMNLFAAPQVEKARDERKWAFISLDGLKDNKGDLPLGSDTDLTITAMENRSTGYQWRVTHNTCGSRVSLQNDEYVAHPSQNGDKTWLKTYGSGGKRTWVFSTPGEASNHIRGLPCEIDFEYQRPWILEEAPLQDQRKVIITVQ